MKTLKQLSKELNAYYVLHSLPQLSADEVVCEIAGDPARLEQYEWLIDFGNEWDASAAIDGREHLIYIRGQWEIATAEDNDVSGRIQWVRRDSSYICNVGAEKAKQDMPPAPAGTMSFAVFQASRKACADLGKALNDEGLTGEPGNVYLDCLYIDEVTDKWPEAVRAAGKWHLMLGRDEWVSNDLEALERRLYAFAMQEGYGE